jgi:ureidoacrylate peracid hydrolase
MSESTSDFRMPQHVLDRVKAKRGHLNVFETFDPKKTAFLVIDMQNFFVDGSESCTRIVPNINRLAAATRAAGGIVVWVSMTVAEGEDAPSLFPVYHDHFFSPDRMLAHKTGLTRGSHGHALDARLEPDPADLTAEKTRFSALVQGASDLHDQLQAHGIENLLIGGTLTNICCESTARDGMMIGYKVMMVEDCNASLTDEDHLAGLTSVYQCFGDVRATDDVIENVIGDIAAAQAAE